MSNSVSNPMVQIIDEDSDKVVYMLRIRGSEFCLKVFGEGRYTAESVVARREGIEGMQALPTGEQCTWRVNLS